MTIGADDEPAGTTSARLRHELEADALAHLPEMDGMRARERTDAIVKAEKIGVIGDYDVDGICAS